MAFEYMLRIKHNQIEPKATGYLSQATYYVDESVVDGLKAGTLAAIKHDGSSLGELQPTLVEADGTQGSFKKASGLLFKETRRDQYGRTDDITEEDHYFPAGNRENTPIGLIKDGVITISKEGTSKHRQFITATLPSAVAEADLEWGQKVSDGAGGVYYYAPGYDGSASHKYFDATGAAAPAAPNPIKPLGMADDALYLAPAGSPLPFCGIKPSVKGNKSQRVGFVAGAAHVRIRLFDEVEVAK